MATQQEVNDLQYDIKLAEQQVTLKDIFSEAIIGWGRGKGVYSYENLKNYVGSIDLSNYGITTFKGIEHLNGTTQISIASNCITDAGDWSGLTGLESVVVNSNPDLEYIGVLSAMINLTSIRAYSCSLTNIGRLDKLTALTYINVYSNILTNIGDISACVSLSRVILSNNQLTSIGSVSGLILLEQFYIEDNQLSTSTVDQLLEDLVIAQSSGAPLVTVNLSGNAAPTGGASNVDYIYLVDQGVSVTIDTI